MTILKAMFEKRASIENPSVPINEQTLDNLFNGVATAAGVQVNEDNAMSLSAVWACVRILSESVASLPLSVYTHKKGAKVKLDDHPVTRLLQKAPNKETTPYAFRETVQAHASTWGNGYAFITRNRMGQPLELMQLLPHATRALRTKDGSLIYETNIGGVIYRIVAADIVHIAGIGYDGLTGYSPIQKHKQAIGLGLAAETYGAKFFGGDAVVQGVLQLPGKLSDTTSLASSWKDAHGGLGNANNIAVLEQGAEYKKIGIPPNDAQFLETRKFQLTDIARIYRIPPHMIADLERATFSNIESQDIQFVKYSLMSHLIRWEQELTRKLLSENEQKKMYIKFNIDAFLRGDTKARYEAYQIGRNTGFLSINDIRRHEDMNEVAGGDEYQLVPVGTQTPNSEGAEDPDTEETPAEKKSSRLMLLQEKMIERLVTQETKALLRCKSGDWFEDPKNKLPQYIADSLGLPDDVVQRFMESGKNKWDEYSDIADFDDWHTQRTLELLETTNKYFAELS